MPGRYNEILVGRYNRFFQKFFEMKGGPPTPQLASELMAVLPLMSGVENRFLEMWDKYGRVIDQVAGGVGNRSGIRLRNPPNSNVVGVVERWSAFIPFTGTNDLPSWLRNVGNGDLTLAPMSFTRMDARNVGGTVGVGKAPALIVSQTGALGAQTGTAFYQAPVTTTGVQADLVVTDIGEIPLLPGDDITLQSLNTNTELLCCIHWRERQLEESERF